MEDCGGWVGILFALPRGMSAVNLVPKKILVSTDFSEASDYAVKYAVGLAKQLGASLVLLHAYEIPLLTLPGSAAALAPEIVQKIVTASEDALRERAAGLRDSGVPIETMLKTGDARQTIVAVASFIHADLIVMGTHGRTGLSRVLIGSVAENVVRTATVPVLTVKPPA